MNFCIKYLCSIEKEMIIQTKFLKRGYDNTWPFKRDHRKEYWSELPFPPRGDLPNPGMKPRSSALQVDSLSSEPPGKPWYHFSLKGSV